MLFLCNAVLSHLFLSVTVDGLILGLFNNAVSLS